MRTRRQDEQFSLQEVGTSFYVIQNTFNNGRGIKVSAPKEFPARIDRISGDYVLSSLVYLSPSLNRIKQDHSQMNHHNMPIEAMKRSIARYFLLQ